MEQAINLNELVKVKLNEAGIDRLKNLHDTLNGIIKQNGGNGIGEWKSPVDNDGYYKTQLWCLFDDFGDMIRIGNNSPFKSNELIITVSPKQSSTPLSSALTPSPTQAG